MKQGILCVLLLALSLVCMGCSQTETRRYDLTVRNETGHTVTLWLTKDGRPEEKGWRSPEQTAVSAAAADERLGGITLPNGKTAFTGEVKGDFQPSASAWLRIYNGQYKSFSDLLAVGPHSPERLDYALSPGRSYLVVRQSNGKMEVESEGQQVKIPGAK